MNQDFGTSTRVLKHDLGTAPRVLIVDDDELMVARLRDLVTAAGFGTFTAASGAQALEILEQTFAPIVITDLNMPDMSGLTLCRTIRQKNWPGYVYVVLLTVRDVEEDILAGLDAGAHISGAFARTATDRPTHPDLGAFIENSGGGKEPSGHD